MDLSSIVLLASVSGYGDPVGGFPSHVERQLHLWTNAARVAPDAFEEEYLAGQEPCSFDDFLADEQVPKQPLHIDLDLTEVARVHSIDMRETPCFQHESCDGTDTFERIGEYYTDSGYVGENIAYGTTDPRQAVMGLWMCSSGHRANILSPDYNELGPGVDADYMTQDFGAGTLSLGAPPVRMAVDVGETVYADWGDDAAPEELTVVVAGVESPFKLVWGEEKLGIWGVDPATTEACTPWYVWWKTAAGDSGTFPEEGSYQIGACDEDWIGEQALRGGLYRDVPADELHDAMLKDVALVGCSATGSRAGWMFAFAAAALLGRRRDPRSRG